MTDKRQKDSDRTLQPVATERRWLRSVIAASAEPLPSFPWMRGAARRRPAAMEAPVSEPGTERPARIGLFLRPGSIAAR